MAYRPLPGRVDQLPACLRGHLFGECCAFVPLAALPEARRPFSPFERVSLASDGA